MNNQHLIPKYPTSLLTDTNNHLLETSASKTLKLPCIGSPVTLSLLSSKPKICSEQLLKSHLNLGEENHFNLLAKGPNLVKNNLLYGVKSPKNVKCSDTSIKLEGKKRLVGKQLHSTNFSLRNRQLSDSITRISNTCKRRDDSELTREEVHDSFRDDIEKEISDVATKSQDDDRGIHLLEQNMPVYNFKTLVLEQPELEKFPDIEKDIVLISRQQAFFKDTLKVKLLTTVSTSLIHNPNFRTSTDTTRKVLMSQTAAVASFDPEFILKVALYTRQELNIRTTANFLLTYAAYIESCRPFLKKYFSSSVRLPSDWIEVAELYLSLKDEGINLGSLPACLRKAMKAKFQEFDQYQLAKYNRGKNRKKKLATTFPNAYNKGIKSKREPVESQENKAQTYTESNEMETEKKVTRCSFTLKQLIRLLHITQPVNHVMCLLGKKYPEEPELFRRSGLPGVWEEERAGVRMKLPVPETWETQVSARGNNAEVWQELIDHNKLPYMAMLRNLRNLLVVGISKSHHRKVLQKISNEDAVIKSRQFPLQFFSAYQAISELEKLLKNSNLKKNPSFVTCKSLKSMKTPPKWKIKQQEKISKRMKNFDRRLLEQYRNAVNNAVEIAAHHNLDPISGNTLVICGMMSSAGKEQQTLKKSPSNMNKPYHGALLLGMMCLFTCEECEMKIITGAVNKGWETASLQDTSILENVLRMAKYYENEDGDVYSPAEFYDSHFEKLLREYLFLPTSKKTWELKSIMFKIVFIPHSPGGGTKHGTTARVPQFNSLAETVHQNDVYISGFSDQLLRFVAERGNGSQMTFVENIDKKYNLRSLPKPALMKKTEDHIEQQLNTLSTPYLAYTPKWKTVKVFISSTFKDMHGERDLLVRYVFPELRARAQSLFVNIHEVDLRWGITEVEATKESSLEVCLSEASQCQLFVAILGERYGWCPHFYKVPEDPAFDWVRKYPKGASITELEIYCAALSNPAAAREKAFFYFRDPQFQNTVPNGWKKDFTTEDSFSKEKMTQLKMNICKSGFEVLDSYPCRWGGVVGGFPVVANLEEFGQRVLDNLWNAVTKFYCPKDTLEEASEDVIHECFAERYLKYPVCWKEEFKQCLGGLKSCNGTIVISGKPGSGKTTFMSHLSKKIKDHPIVTHFVGADSQSANLNNLLLHILNSVCSKLSLTCSLPKNKQEAQHQFLEVLREAVSVSSSKTLLILIDGLDQLSDEGQSPNLDWLPQDLPTGVKIVCSVSEDSSTYCTFLDRMKAGSSVMFISLKQLCLSERKSVVTMLLEPYRKSLDESPFNNQMLLLVSKSDASQPLYLSLACEELRAFGGYENLTAQLRSLPQTLPSLLQEMVQNIEKEHGLQLVQMAFLYLALTPYGLEERELHTLLSIQDTLPSVGLGLDDFKQKISTLKPDAMIPPALFSKLVLSLRRFLHPTGDQCGDVLRLSHVEIKKAVQVRYLNSLRKQQDVNLHYILAALMLHKADPQGSKTWTGKWPEAFQALPYHLCRASCTKYLSEIFCDLSFIEAYFRLGQGSCLLDNFNSLLITGISTVKTFNKDENLNKKVSAYYQFISRNLHILLRYPSLVRQQALNEPDSSCVYTDAVQNTSAWAIHWLTRPQFPEPLRLTLSEFREPIQCLAVSRKGDIAGLGGQDGVIRLIDVQTGSIKRTLTGHIQKITSICFVGNDKLCSSSVDKSLCLWDITRGYRIGVLDGHIRSVTSCASDPDGTTIVSTGWDKTIRIWSGKDCREITCIKQNKKPVSCIDFHPEKQLLVSGGWDQTVKLWDLVTVRRKAILHGHKGSVQFVAFSTSGQHIVSSSSRMEVFLWSASQGTRIGKMEGHILPVTCASFSISEDIMITGSKDRTLKVWISYSKAVVHTIPQSVLSSTPTCMIFLDISYVAVGQETGEVCLFDTQKGALFWKKMLVRDSVNCISSFKKPSSGTLCGICVASKTGQIKVVLLEDGSNLLDIQALQVRRMITSLSQVGRYLVAGYQDGTVCLFSCKGKNRGAVLSTVTAHEGPISGFAMLNDDLFFTTSLDRKVNKWKVVVADSETEGNTSVNLVLEQSLNDYHLDWITSCSLKDNFLVTGSADASVRVWDVKTEKEPCVLYGLQSSVVYVAKEGGYIFAGCADGSSALWNINGNLITSLPSLYFQKNYPAFILQKEDENTSKENRFRVLIATTEEDGSITIRKPFSRIAKSTLYGHSEPVLGCAMIANEQLVSTSQDRTVKFWNLKILTDDNSKHHKGQVKVVRISDNGGHILSGDELGKLVIWELTRNNSLFVISYCGHEEWTKGSITTAVFVHPEGKQVLCTVSQHTMEGKESFLISIKVEFPTPNKPNSLFSLKIQNQHKLVDEGITMNYASRIDCVAIGTRQGYLYLTDKTCRSLRTIHLMDKWLTALGLIPGDTLGMFIADEKGDILSCDDIYNNPQPLCKVVSQITSTEGQVTKGVWPTALLTTADGAVFVGDVQGFVTVIREGTTTVVRMHTKSVTAICCTENLLFTSSLDGTLKVWDLFSQKQLGQFHMPVPISAVSVHSCGRKLLRTVGNILIVCGTASGHVHLLLWKNIGE
ncbi:telomerase protein component 1-like [Limulus polyphemus]|uniref:Telomerase protein component 1-like n=1 Tax=Limulus polyphemus TaxID=6850 RepID=A0ABM1TAW9_LIMPO|nr:telomerase protein component 1-like [Limulus polyphemus]